jgi:hypothetical protein
VLTFVVYYKEIYSMSTFPKQHKPISFAIRQALLILALGVSLPLPGMAAGYNVTGGSAGSGGNGGDGGDDNASGASGMSGASGGAGGQGGGMPGGAGMSGSAGATGSHPGDGAAGNGGNGGNSGSPSANGSAGGGGGGGGGGHGGSGHIQSINDATIDAVILSGGNGGNGGQGGIGGKSRGTTADGGGSGGDGGSGGGGGNAGLTAINASSVGDIALTGGSGGNGGNGGNGGADDGSGDAGNGGNGGNGGDGGNASLALANASVTGNIVMNSGKGGNGGNGGDGAISSNAPDRGGSGGNAGSSGKGGNVNLVLESAMTRTGVIAITSGQDGTSGNSGANPVGGNPSLNGHGGNGGGGGQAGSASFSARILSTPEIVLTQQDGGLSFKVDTLDVTDQDTLVKFTRTHAGDVHFKIIDLGGGRTLDARAANMTTYSFDTLKVRGENANIIGDLDASERTLDFYPLPTLAPGATFLAVTGSADVTHAAVRLPALVGLQGGTSHRDQLALLKANVLTGDAANAGEHFMGLQGVSLAHDYVLVSDSASNTLQLQAVSIKAAPQAKALSEGFLSGLAFINRGADLAAEQGMRLAADSAKHENGHHVFGTLSGGSLRYKSGSHIDADGASLIIGISAGQNFAPGRLTLGAFVEYGRGDYDARNSLGAAARIWSFNHAARLRGNGDNRYVGGGLLGRYEAHSGHYVEASARAGKLSTSFASNDLGDYLGHRAAYDLDTRYYGVHAGVGYVWKINGNQELDLYGKYLWTRQQGRHAILSTGDDIHFETADSERLRAGLRLRQKLSDTWQGYAGLACEHEFNGKARATSRTTANAYAIDAPELKGSVYMGEIGLRVEQGARAPLSVDLGLQSLSGQREGVTGHLHVNWAF